MRLPKERVHHMADSVIARLHELNFLEVTGDRKALRESFAKGHITTGSTRVQTRGTVGSPKTPTRRPGGLERPTRVEAW